MRKCVNCGIPLVERDDRLCCPNLGCGYGIDVTTVEKHDPILNQPGIKPIIVPDDQMLAAWIAAGKSTRTW
jgi:uncharacterized Zn finger protein (UPF0148 family)